MKKALLLLFLLLPTIAFADKFKFNPYTGKLDNVGTLTAGTLTDAKFCTYTAATDTINCTSTAGGSSQWLTNPNVGIGTYSNVGIGTIATSSSTLSVIGNIGIGTTAGDAYMTTGPPNGGLIAYGNVGLGTFVPTSSLTVQGSSGTTSLVLNSANVANTCGANQFALLHMDGTNGSTTFTDQNCNGSGAKTFTANGNAQLSTAQVKFGTASGLFDGTGDYLQNSTDTFWLLTTTNFTYEAWIYPRSAIGTEGLWGYGVSANNFYALSLDATNINFINRDAGSNTISISGPHGMTINNWYHVVLERNGNNFNISVNGVSVASGTSSASLNNTAGGTFRIGEANVGAGFSDFNGNMDEFRASSVPIFSFPFTPPSAAYASSGGVTSTTYQIDNTTYFSTGIDKTDGEKYKISNGALGASDRVVITTAGNVGINTSVPPNILYVGGTTETQGFKMPSAPTAGYALITNSVGVGTWAPITVAGGGGSSQWITYGQAGNVGIGTTDSVGIGTTLQTGAGLIVMNGNVGIGTWKPAGPLQIIGSGNIGINTTNPQSQLSVGGNLSIGAAYSTLAAPANGGIFQGNVGIGTSTPQGAFTVTSGNVGIGTWSPNDLLNVKGTATFTGGLTTNASINMTSGDLNAANTTGIYYGARATLLSPADGIVEMTNHAINDFTRIDLGGTSSSFPAIGRTGTGTYIGLADGTNGGSLGIGTTLVGTSALTVMDGNVGIGTWIPGSLFQVAGSGNVGIGTLTPGALVDIGGNLRLATGGFFVSQQTTAPTIANNDCGTTAQGTVAANSADLLGTVSVGTLAVTSCAMTFNKTHATAPICFCQDDSNVLAVRCSTTTTKMTITSATSMSSDVVAYWCPTNIP